MQKYSFKNDYSEGVHQQILEVLGRTNTDQMNGYGEDEVSQQAAGLIKKQLNDEGADIHLVSGGTQANLIVLAALMKPYEAVVAASTGHINVHEAGAIEATGHKILAVSSADGKLTVEMIQQVVDAHTDEHMVLPRVVFISNSTEVGTIYQKSELEALSAYCRSHNLYLYMDGARLGSGLCSPESDLTLADVARLVDIFYIGGTKNGALLGEAIVITNTHLKSEFRYHLKQHGALLAKGRVIGAQFVGLFTNNLFYDLARHANAMAAMLTAGIRELGYNFLSESSTNQIFPILPNVVIEKLSKEYGFYVWARHDEGSSAIRLVTSWATPEDKVREFLTDLKRCS